VCEPDFRTVSFCCHSLQWTNLGQKFSSNTDLANVEGIHIFADIVPFLLLWKVKMLLHGNYVPFSKVCVYIHVYTYMCI
jgi:hypothetical protein